MKKFLIIFIPIILPITTTQTIILIFFYLQIFLPPSLKLVDQEPSAILTFFFQLQLYTNRAFFSQFQPVYFYFSPPLSISNF